MKQVITLLLLFITTQSYAQKMTLPEIENNLNNTYQNISGNGYPSTADSIEEYDSLFRQKMLYFMSHYPETLTYPFDSLQHNNDISIVTSKDGLFRIYSWDRYDGGTMHSFDNLFQYKSGGKVYAKLSADTGTDQNYDAGVSYKELYKLKAGNNKKVYLALGAGIGSTAISTTRIKIFSIEGKFLNDTLKLIRTRDLNLINSIDIGLNVMLNYPDTDYAIPNGVKYFPKEEMLSVPIVNEWNDSVTVHSNIYQFNGKYFKFIKQK